MSATHPYPIGLNMREGLLWQKPGNGVILFNRFTDDPDVFNRGTPSAKPYIKRLSVPSIRTFSTLCLLSVLALILPQCSDKNSDEYYKEGLAYIELQDYQGAEQAFQNAIDKDPKNPYGHYGLGGVHNYRKQYDVAENDLRICRTHCSGCLDEKLSFLRHK